MQDELWKQIIEALFPDFVAFFMPDLAAQVDFEQPYHFLDQELQALSPEAEQGNRRVDRLVKVFLTSGQEQWVLIHAEVQGYYDVDFAERMFVYFYRVFDKYRQKIAAIAIFAEQRKAWAPASFNYDFAQTHLQYQYPVYKILDQPEADLINSDNPFALVILAALYALRSQRKTESIQLQFKLELIDLLFQKSYDSTKIKAIFHFVNTLIKMKNPATQIHFVKEVQKMATTNEKVRVLSDYEEVMMRETATKMKADGMATDLIAKYTGLTPEEIAKL